ncbi:MAG: ATP-binding protein [Anaerolineae bacterium]|nr:ATP-binding protein [Anaerolineae bacterium]
MGESTQKLVIDSRLEATTEARRWIAQQARAAGFGPEVIFAVELAAGEALANVVEHAYGQRPGHQIHLSLTTDEKKLTLTIRDFGRKFDGAAFTPHDPAAAIENGRGVFLIYELMDEVVYDTSLPTGTQLKLVKYRGGQ